MEQKKQQLSWCIIIRHTHIHNLLEHFICACILRHFPICYTNTGWPKVSHFYLTIWTLRHTVFSCNVFITPPSSTSKLECPLCVYEIYYIYITYNVTINQGAYSWNEKWKFRFLISRIKALNIDNSPIIKLLHLICVFWKIISIINSN